VLNDGSGVQVQVVDGMAMDGVKYSREWLRQPPVLLRSHRCVRVREKQEATGICKDTRSKGKYIPGISSREKWNGRWMFM
jgi:hypothetical protein